VLTHTLSVVLLSSSGRSDVSCCRQFWRHLAVDWARQQEEINRCNQDEWNEQVSRHTFTYEIGALQVWTQWLRGLGFQALTETLPVSLAQRL